MSTRLENLRMMLARIEREIEREEAYQRRMATLRTDYRNNVTNRSDWNGRIVAAAAAHFRIPAETVAGPSRTVIATEARHVACWLMRDAKRPFPEIARAVGRDHSTVIKSVRRVEESPELMAEARAVQAFLQGEEEVA